MTTTRADDDKICRACNRRHGVDGYNPRHPFKPAGNVLSGPETDDTPAAVTPVRVPFDPVLRLALIRKGVITPDDLADAEAEMRVTTAVFQDAAHVLTGDDGKVHRYDVS